MAFTIKHGPTGAATADLAQAIGVQQGQDAARQELDALAEVANRQRLAERELEQRAILEREGQRAATERVRLSGEMDLDRVREQGRIYNWQINRQGQQNQQRDAANNAAELAERSLLETMQTSPPAVQRQISGILQQRSVIMSDPTLRPEQRQALLTELNGNLQRVMEEAQAYQQPDPQQSFDAMRAVDPESGQAYFIGPDGSIEQAAQFHNTPRGLEMRLQAEHQQARMRQRAEVIEALTVDADPVAGTPRRLPSRREVDEYMALLDQTPPEPPAAQREPGGVGYLGETDDGVTAGLRVDDTGRFARIRTASGEETNVAVGQLSDEDLIYWAAQIVGLPEGQAPTNPQQEAAMVNIVRALRGGGR